MSRQPTIFFGHGSPMNALGSPLADAWRTLGATLEKPRAILAVSAHWYVPGVAVTAMERPKTIHDFGGFPRQLYDMQYPAPGAPFLADRVAELLAPLQVGRDMEWGLDHGTWSILAHLFPDADIPVAQLSIDRRQPGEFHFELGRKLAALRDEGVLIIGSGDIVHNLGAVIWQEGAAPHPWAVRFNEFAKQAIVEGRPDALFAGAAISQDARLSIPTPEHFWPLLYVLGARQDGDAVRFITDSIDLGAISMTGVVLG